MFVLAYYIVYLFTSALHINCNKIIISSDNGRINLYLDAVMELKYNNEDNDKVSHNNNDNKVSNNMNIHKLSDFIVAASSILKKYHEKDVKELVTVIVDEIVRCNGKHCKFNELLQNKKYKAFFHHKVEVINNMSGDVIKTNIQYLANDIKNLKSNQIEKQLIDFIDNFYVSNPQIMFNKVLRFLDNNKLYPRKGRNLKRIGKALVKAILFDQYANLKTEERFDLKSKINEYWDKQNTTRVTKLKKDFRNSSKQPLLKYNTVQKSRVRVKYGRKHLITGRQVSREEAEESGDIKKLNTTAADLKERHATTEGHRVFIEIVTMRPFVPQKKLSSSEKLKYDINLKPTARFLLRSKSNSSTRRQYKPISNLLDKSSLVETNFTTQRRNHQSLNIGNAENINYTDKDLNVRHTTAGNTINKKNTINNDNVEEPIDKRHLYVTNDLKFSRKSLREPIINNFTKFSDEGFKYRRLNKNSDVERRLHQNKSNNDIGNVSRIKHIQNKHSKFETTVIHQENTNVSKEIVQDNANIDKPISIRQNQNKRSKFETTKIRDSLDVNGENENVGKQIGQEKENIGKPIRIGQFQNHHSKFFTDKYHLRSQKIDPSGVQLETLMSRSGPLQAVDHYDGYLWETNSKIINTESNLLEKNQSNVNKNTKLNETSCRRSHHANITTVTVSLNTIDMKTKTKTFFTTTSWTRKMRRLSTFYSILSKEMKSL